MHFHIKALRAALDELGLPYSEIPGFGDALVLGDRAFIRATTSFNSESTGALCRDKDAVYKILSGIVPMPRTRSFLDPQGRYPELSIVRSIDEIVAGTLDFLYPRMVKMNSGDGGKNVFVVHHEAGMREALSVIFDKTSRHYDYIALVQEYIEPRYEYRVAVAGGKPVFAYARKVFEPIEGDALSRFAGLCEAIIAKLGISWGALDFIESHDGSLYFLEANTRPLYGGFIAAQGDRRIKELYKKALAESVWNASVHTRTDISSSLSSVRL